MMTETEIKAFLCKVRKPPKDFEVTLTHKTHRRIHGTYYPSDHLIKINDRNFTRDCVMLLTAIHEYAHHLQFCMREKTSHNREFYALFHDLMDAAEEKKLLDPEPTTEKIEKLQREVRDLLQQHADLEGQIAETLIALHRECEENSVDIEYFVERRLQLPHNGDRPYIKCMQGSNGYGPDEYRNAEEMRVIATKGEAAELALRDGKTIVQAQTAATKKEELEPYEALKKEKEQIVNRIEKLTDRKETVEGKMRQFELQFDNTAEEPGRKTG